MYNATELIKLAGSKGPYRAKIDRSWVRPMSLVFLLLVATVLLSLIVNTPGLKVTVAGFSALAFGGAAVMMLLLWNLFDSYRMWNTDYTLTTEAVNIYEGRRLTRSIPLTDIVKTDLRGLFVRLVSGGRVKHVTLTLRDGERLLLRDLMAAELVEHCILFRREKLEAQ